MQYRYIYLARWQLDTIYIYLVQRKSINFLLRETNMG